MRTVGEGQEDRVLELPLKDDQRPSLDAFLSEHFGTTLDDLLPQAKPTELFADLQRSSTGLSCRVLMIHGSEGEGVGRYSEGKHAEDRYLNEELRDLRSGEKRVVRFSGETQHEALQQLAVYIGWHDVPGVVEEHRPGTLYRVNGCLCVNAKVGGLGIHLRPSGSISTAAARHPDAGLEIIRGERHVSAYELMGILTLAVCPGETITIRCDAQYGGARTALFDVYRAVQK